MCGIAAIFAYHSAAPGVDTGELRAIRDCMKSRGPDGEGAWLDANRRVGLGHRRLSIIDLSPGGAQPMLLPEHQLAISFNGEIYNYRELRAGLEKKGHAFTSTSDTEVLLRLYVERGEAMLDELRGMYAFAIWDGERNGLFLARDPFGIKPLYCADDGKTFRAASQVKALLAGQKIDPSPDPAGHVGFFIWGHVPEPYTFYRSIRALPAGTTLWVGSNGARRQRTFCSVTEILSCAERDASSAPVSRSLLSTALRDSVKHHLVADVPVGVFLSSGLDSTTLAALASEQGGSLRTVTLGFDEYRGTANDETPLAEAVAQQYRAEHQTIWVRRDDFREHIDRVFNAMDMPSTDGVNTYFVSLAAKSAGLKVALSGLGGDEMFGGYPSFSEIPRAVRLLKPFNAPVLQSFDRAFRAVTAPVLKHFTSPKYASCLEYGGSYGGAYLLRRGMFMPWELPEFLDADVVRQGWAELQPLVRLDETLNGLRRPRARVSSLEMCWYMRNQLLRDSDWAGMAHSLEIRVPLVDVELLRAVAPLLAGNDPPTKLDMASSPTASLPASVLNRPKTGFSIPVRQWLLEIAQPSTFNSRPISERGLRGWTKYVYGRFAGTDAFVRGNRASHPSIPAKNGRAGSPLPAASHHEPRRAGSDPYYPSSISDLSSPQAARGPVVSGTRFGGRPALRCLVLATDAFGGHGGIAKFNRDLLGALCTAPGVEEVVAVPRLLPEPPGELPAKLVYVTAGIGGKFRYLKTVLNTVRRSPASDVLICGHINLLPVAFLARWISSLRTTHPAAPCPLLLVIHGIDAWQPTPSRLANRLVRKIDGFISVSEFTKQRFLGWAKLNDVRNFILPNCVDLARFTPGPKNPQLLERYGLRNRTVLLTLARLSAQERYKGIDEVIEVLPELAQQIPNLSYLVAGDGNDRERLINKARSLGLDVKREDRRSKIAGPSPIASIPSPANPSVVFAGRIPETEKVDHYRLADAFVMPGWGEGFGIAYLEAMGCGVPVVASKLDASQEAVRNGNLGIVVNPREPGEIQCGILAALKNGRGIGPPGLEYFSAQNFEARVHRILEAMLKPAHK